MTVNVEALINNLGSPYSILVDSGLITYRTPPTGYAGDPDLSLNMAKEGLYLSFLREGRILQEISLHILRSDVNNWQFPNELPFNLQNDMSRTWIHERFGEPLKSAEPRVVMRRSFGWIDIYEMSELINPTVMRIDYDLDNKAKDVTFLPAENLAW